jgi:hypothetical protein
MESQSRTLDEAEPDPMLPEQFEIAANATQIRKPELISASRAVLVDGAAAPEIAKKFNIDDVSNIYRAVSSIRQKWEQICAAEEWEYLPLAFPRSVMSVMLAFQRELLKNYGEKKAKRGRHTKK